MKVKLLKPKTAYGIEYKPGEELDVRPEIADKMVSAEEAEYFDKPATEETVEQPEPEVEEITEPETEEDSELVDEEKVEEE